ncbi:26960_t:CDS:2, partial [Racocetra persica]
MSTSNIATHVSTKQCSCYNKVKPTNEFISQRGTKIQEFSRCNPCTEHERQNTPSLSLSHENKLFLSLSHENTLSLILNHENTSSFLLSQEDISSFPLSHEDTLFLTLNYKDILFLFLSHKNMLPISSNRIMSSNSDSIKSNKNENKIIYNICDLEEFVAIKFKDHIEFTIIVKIEDELVNEENLSLELN